MIKEEINIIERNVNQLRGYFQTQEDILIKDNALRMLDEIEIILKKTIEKSQISHDFLKVI